MAPHDNPGPDPPGETSRSDLEDTLRRLDERLARASDAAERLLAEAARSAAGRVAAAGEAARAGAGGSAQSPPAGWESPLDGAGSAGRARGEAELESLLGVVRSLRDLIPAELQRRLTEALRELLLAVRALIDWYLERLEQRRTTPVRVEDIPIL